MNTRPFIPTEEQRAAIECATSMVVTARPGSGKTAVVSAKIRQVLPTLSTYQGIIAISYTNKASDELEQRCKAGAVDAKRSFFGTIDDFCIRDIIRPFASHIFKQHRELTIVKANELSEDIAALLPQKPLSEAQILDTMAFLPFLRACHNAGLLVLDSVGILAFYVLNGSPACQRYVQAKYKAVFVDEYQDAGYFQHQLFIFLKELGLRAVAVGDADQSIFLFAKKDPRHLLSLTKADSGFASFSLTINHRSHASITAYASSLLDPQFPYTFDPASNVYQISIQGAQQSVAQWLNRTIPRAVAHFHASSLSSVGILCANKHTAKLVAENIGLPHRLYEDGPFGSSPNLEATLLIELLSFHFDASRNAQDIINRFSRTGRSRGDERTLRAAILQCRLDSHGMLEEHVRRGAETVNSRLLSNDAVKQLHDVCLSPEALRWFTPPVPNEVQILTLHKSKGLEFDIVFHLDLYDWILPRRIPGKFYGEVVFADEKQCLNLHYVGVTRAIKACILVTSTERYNGSGELKKNAQPSQFFGRNGVTARPL